jgi:hypothetical protein
LLSRQFATEPARPFSSPPLSRPATASDEAALSVLSARLAAECAAGIWHGSVEWENTFLSLPASAFPRLAHAVRPHLAAPAQSELRRVLFGHWGRMAPASALAVAAELPPGPWKNATYVALLQSWIRADLGSALAWLRAQPDSDLRLECIQLSLSYFATLDPEAALILVELVPPAYRGTSYRSVFEAWATRAPAVAARRAAALELPWPHRLAAFEGVARAWTRSAPLAALAWADQLPLGRIRDCVRSSIIRLWTELDPSAASAYALQLPPGSRRAGAIEQVVAGWPKDDPKGAVDFAARLPSGNHRNILLRDLVATWADTDPASAFGYATTLPNGAIKPELLGEVLGRLAIDQPTAALDAARHIPPGLNRDHALSVVLTEISRREPETAFAFLRDTAAGDSRNHLLKHLGDHLSFEAPAVAARFVSLLPPGELQTRAIPYVVDGLAQQNLEAAKAWAFSLPDGCQRTQALQSYAVALAKTDSAAAVAWAAALPPAEGGARVLDSVLAEWVAASPPGLQRFPRAPGARPPCSPSSPVLPTRIPPPPSISPWKSPAS